MIPALKTAMEGSTCSGVYFSLDATANTSLPDAENFRMGVYLRYSSLRSVPPSGTTTYFRGTVDAARECGLQLHNRWNPELNTALIPGYLQVMSWTGDRLSGGCLWTERIPLLDTWESVTLFVRPCQGWCGDRARRLRYGAERPLLQPGAQRGFQLLRRLPHAACAVERRYAVARQGHAG